MHLLFEALDRWNYMPPILVPSPVTHITATVLVIVKLNEREDLILRGFVCDIICPCKELPAQS